MPVCFAAAARDFPTAAACAVLSPSPPWPTSSHDEAASVRPESSSTSWAKMPRFERNATSRGRSAVPRTLPRTRRWRRRRASRVLSLVLKEPAPVAAKLPPPLPVSLRRAYGSCPLPDLATDELALLADALALVWLRRPHPADLCGRLADDLLVDPANDDLCRRRHLERDAFARLDLHGVRVADLELEIGSGHRGTVANALNLEALLEALRDALDHVRDERARE